MIRIVDHNALTDSVKKWRRQGLSIGLVPTMGYFHAGHVALMKESITKADKTVVSLFVNPRQFGPREDLSKYPRDPERDAEIAKVAGVDILFTPSEEIMYPAGYQTNISLKNLSQGLCGKSRPGHFDGVATIIVKLFNLVQPDIAIFGEKDYQQLALIRQLTADLNFDITVYGHPIVREPDGLAMSSRNMYLDKDERKNALCLSRALVYAQQTVQAKRTFIASSHLIDELHAMIEVFPGCKVDYIAIVEPDTLLVSQTAEPGKVLAVAVYINNKVRLIDNCLL